MKRLLSIAAVAAGVAGLAVVAMAGDYHVGQLLVCSDCHVMHGSQSHAYPETGEWNVPGSKSLTAPPYNLLLRQESVNTVCLACHDGRTDVPDVLGSSAAAPTHGRNAGALNTESGHNFSNDAGYTTSDGHTLWSTAMPPGNDGTYTTTDGLECADCHSAHGSANFRNMRTSTSTTSSWYNKPVTYEIGGTPTNTKDVYEAAARGYGWDNVNYQEPDQTKSAYGNWCMKCHTKFHGTPTDANINGGVTGDVVRHPTAGFDMSSSRMTQLNKHTHKVKLMDELGKWDGTTTTMTPSCFTCHKSHGNKNGFGLIWFVDNTTTGPNTPATPTDVTEEGDGGAYRDLCRQCHTQGSFPVGNPTNIIP